VLSPKAEQLIHDYLNLPFTGVDGVRCPYFNNWKLRQRGQLKVLIGKGTPKEIVEETKIISIQYHAGLFDKNGRCCLHHERADQNADGIRKFLIDQSLGIDCSGFATYVLAAHYAETRHINLLSKIFIAPPKNFLRWAINKLRPVENVGVSVLAHNKNSELVACLPAGMADGMKSIDWNKIQPADFISIIKTGPQHNRNHIILITENTGNTLRYIHARAWPSEGKYGHGVAKGEIKITKPDGTLLEQEWVELGKVGEKNETYMIDVKMARVLEVRRMRVRMTNS